MTTKTVNSTISTLLQDNSSVEYVDSQKNPLALKDLPPGATIKESFIVEKQYRMHVASLFGFEARVIVTNPEDIKDPRSTWWCLADTGNAIGSSKSGSLLGLLRKRERDSRIFTNDEIIFDDFRGKNPLPLNNRGQVFVSLSGFLEILSKTELSSDKADDFQEEIFGRVLPQLAFEGKAEVSDEYKEKIGMPQPQAQPTIYDYARALIAEKERSDALEAQNKALTAERDEAIRTKTQYQSNLAAQMSGRVGGLTTALNRVRLENDRLKGDRFTKEDVYIIMNTQGVSFTLKTVKDVIRESLNTISEYLDEPFPKIKVGERTDSNGKTFDVVGFVYTRKTVQAFFEYVENNPLGWQARNRKFILGEWLNHHMTIPA